MKYINSLRLSFNLPAKKCRLSKQWSRNLMLLKMNFLKITYNWTLEKAQHKNAKWYLSLISFAESSFFPIPPDILLIPMALASKAKALFYAFICTLFSVLGGILGYAIGYFFIIQ